MGVFVKNSLLENYSLVTDKSMEDVIWLKFSDRQSKYKFTVCFCYLPPGGSTRKYDGEAFYNELMMKFYDCQNEGDIIVLGDFNARCGDEVDYIEGVDDIPPREIIDDKLNPYGQLLIDFLVDCNLCMINGRLGESNFTNINVNGSSVVDYIIVPHEQLQKYEDFNVHTMSSFISNFSLHGHHKMSQHSLLQVTLTDGRLKEIATGENEPVTRPKYKLNEILSSFLNCESSFKNLMKSIQRIEKSLFEEQDVQCAYTEFVELLHTEMNLKLEKRKCFQTKQKHKPHKSNAKGY